MVTMAKSAQASDINRLNVIHVAGTKGKGSTCAFIDSFLECHSERTGYPRKRGLYTSPHLLAPEERIRINMRPLSKDMFAQYFFEVLDALRKHDDTALGAQPRFLQLFFLLALHTFIREGVDAAIIETHHGGEYDATNIIEQPVVTAITSLGLDHVSQLGPSIENIAWHKAGIFKSGAAAFSVVEDPSVATVLEARAAAKGADLTFVDLDPTLPRDNIKLQPDVQRLNCSLALAVSRCFLSQRDSSNPELHHSDVLEGIRRFSWPGRFQIVVDGNNTWYLDGAHNAMSAEIASKWFMEASTTQRQNPEPRILIFGQVSEQRDPTTVIQSLAKSFHAGDIQVAIFTLYDPVEDFETPSSLPRSNDTEPLHRFANVWSAFHPNTKLLFAEDVPQALNLARAHNTSDNGLQALITGSQHLVGAALFSLGHRG